MPVSTRTLPANYTLVDNIDLSQNVRLAVILNIIAALLFFISLGLVYLFLVNIRPETASRSFSLDINLFSLLYIAGFFLAIAINLVLHEAIHGFFFWLFTGDKPVFALHLAYAYAAAPAWYLPRARYAIVGLAPLLLINAAILAWLPFAPQFSLVFLLIMLAFNTGGAIGDIWIVSRLWRLSPAALINDHGDCVRFYQPQ
ncbi:MAG: DUF3267 domain-containing protein [Anaerolineae bacterium]|nr:DUF3267 domain-containing protein [Anaerolineae bacterium]